MSRFVEWGGKYWERAFFEVPLDLPPGVCGHCGGLGVVPESIDEERYDVAVHCPWCRLFCRHCRAWVKRAEHVCPVQGKP
jgi:hypothetical protein